MRLLKPCPAERPQLGFFGEASDSLGFAGISLVAGGGPGDVQRAAGAFGGLGGPGGVWVDLVQKQTRAGTYFLGSNQVRVGTLFFWAERRGGVGRKGLGFWAEGRGCSLENKRWEWVSFMR